MKRDILIFIGTAITLPHTAATSSMQAICHAHPTSHTHPHNARMCMPNTPEIAYPTLKYSPQTYPQRKTEQPRYLSNAPPMLRIAINADASADPNGGSDTDTMDASSDIRTEDCTPAQGTFKASPWSDGQPRPGAASRGRQRGQIKKQAWTPLEDQRLIELVGMHGPSCWSEIAKSLEGRVGKQC
eukprot:2083281-Pleurochrysis_carterae.AAC.3